MLHAFGLAFSGHEVFHSLARRLLLKEHRVDFTGDRDLLVVYDAGTGCLAVYSVKNKSVLETAKRLTHFRRKDKSRFFL